MNLTGQDLLEASQKLLERMTRFATEALGMKVGPEA